MPSSNWTKAQVRHKEPKWYWVRCKHGMSPQQMHYEHGKTKGAECCGTARPWYGFERTRNPIPEPPK